MGYVSDAYVGLGFKVFGLLWSHSLGALRAVGTDLLEPLQRYKDEDHVGYDIAGERVMRSLGIKWQACRPHARPEKHSESIPVQ